MGRTSDAIRKTFRENKGARRKDKGMERRKQEGNGLRKDTNLKIKEETHANREPPTSCYKDRGGGG